jgi:recombination protein RecR
LTNLAPPLERVISELCKLPSIGRKTAQRLAFHLLKAPEEDARALAQVIGELRSLIRFCRDCFNLSDAELCPVCSDTRRDRSVLCIVEEASNLIAVERTGAYHGLYHVLGGALSPLKDVGPEQLHVRELMDRLGSSQFQEIILATNPDVEGEATAVYLSRLIQPLEIRVTRLAQGLPAGSDLEYTDDLTLRRAMEGRRSY